MVVSFIDEGNRSTRRKPLTCLKSRTNLITLYCIEYTSTWTGFELTNLVVIGTDCRASCKSNYHAITTTTAPVNKEAAYQLHELFPPLAAASNNYNLRNSHNIHVAFNRLSVYQNSYFPCTIQARNAFDRAIRDFPTFSSFIQKLQQMY
jgi:hypothetical protein